MSRLADVPRTHPTAVESKLGARATAARRFAFEVLAAFSRNRGLLLAGGIAYNALLSLVPLGAIVLLGLSSFVSRERILETLRAELRYVVPGHVDGLLESVVTLLDSREVIGVVLLLVLLFLSSLCFRMVEDAFAVIFGEPEDGDARPFWLRALVPYLFVLVVTLGLLLLTIATSVVESVVARAAVFVESGVDLGAGAAWLLRLAGFAGVALTFTGLYAVLPSRKVALRRAAIGGVAAALLWEGARHLVVWYLATISLVGVVYGSLATVVVLLLTLEVGAVILLLGGQAIAVLQARAGADGAAAAQADTPALAAEATP